MLATPAKTLLVIVLLFLWHRVDEPSTAATPKYSNQYEDIHP